MQSISKRIFIYAADIVLITGKTLSAAHRLIKRIKKANNKSDATYITVIEFCNYMKLKEDEVRRYLT